MSKIPTRYYTQDMDAFTAMLHSAVSVCRAAPEGSMFRRRLEESEVGLEVFTNAPEFEHQCRMKELAEQKYGEWVGLSIGALSPLSLTNQEQRLVQGIFTLSIFVEAASYVMAEDVIAKARQSAP